MPSHNAAGLAGLWECRGAPQLARGGYGPIKDGRHPRSCGEERALQG